MPVSLNIYLVVNIYSDCNQMLMNSCPGGFLCRYDKLTKKSVCCGATDMGKMFQHLAKIKKYLEKNKKL